MANYLTTDTDLTAVANAIRTKGGTSASLSFPSGFVTAIQNISGGGGASNFVTGTFTTGSTEGAQSVTINYTGTGYPIMAVVVIDGGAYVSNTTWYTTIKRYAVGQWTMTKSVFSSTPTYDTSGTENTGVITTIYKNSTSSANSYTRTSSMNANAYSSSAATASSTTCVKFRSDGKHFSVYVMGSSYGLFPSMTYRYYIVYSS